MRILSGRLFIKIIDGCEWFSEKDQNFDLSLLNYKLKKSVNLDSKVYNAKYQKDSRIQNQGNLQQKIRKSPALFNRIFCKVLSITKLKDFLHYNLFWNSTSKYIIEGYLAFTLESLTLMNKGLDWTSALNQKQALFAIFAMIVCGIAPLAMTVFFIINFTKFRNQNFLRRYSSIIGDFNYRQKWSPIFITIFCYRRLVLSVLIVYFPSYPYAQVQLLTLSWAFVVIIFGYSNVYQISKSNKLEFFNEAKILLCCYHMFCFTDFVDDPTVRYKIGISLIFFTSLNLVFNCSIMAFETFKSLYSWGKAKYQQWRNWKHIKNIKLRQKNLKEELEKQVKERDAQMQLFNSLDLEDRIPDQIKPLNKMNAQAKQEKSALTKNKQKQLDQKKQKKHKKSKTQNNQLIKIEEVESNMEESDRQQKKEVASQFESRENQLQLTTGLKLVDPQQQPVQRDNSWTSLYAPMNTEFPSYKLTVPLEQSEEEKRKRKERRLQMGISFENDLFSKNSKSLQEEIEQTQFKIEKRETQTQLNSKLVISEMTDLNKSRQAIQYDHNMTPNLSDINDDPEYQFAVVQKKRKLWW